jgi:hypothetical protein
LDDEEKQFIDEWISNNRIGDGVIEWKNLRQDLKNRFGFLRSENMVKNYWYSKQRQMVGATGIATAVGATGIAGAAGTAFGATGIARAAGTAFGATGIAGAAGTVIGATGIAGAAGTAVATGIAIAAGTAGANVLPPISFVLNIPFDSTNQNNLVLPPIRNQHRGGVFVLPTLQPYFKPKEHKFLVHI